MSGLLPMHPTVYIKAWRRRHLALSMENEDQSNVEAADDKEDVAEMKESS